MSTNGSTPVATKMDVLLAIFDFPMLNVAFRTVIDAEPDMRVVGIAESQASMMEQLAALGPDVVITECQPYNGRGCTSFAAIEAIRAARPIARILALECRCSSEQFSLALKAGADGFLTREAGATDVLAALRTVRGGQTYVSPAIVTKMVNTYVLRTDPGCLDDPYESLSEREREVLLLAAGGHTNREIAHTMHLAEQTIRNYRAHIMEKLGLHDRVELLKYALRRGVIEVAEL